MYGIVVLEAKKLFELKALGRGNFKGARPGYSTYSYTDAIKISKRVALSPTKFSVSYKKNHVRQRRS